MTLGHLKGKSQISSLIAQGINDSVVSYDYLLVMAEELDIPAERLKEVLWEFIDEGYLEEFVEVRCPYCGAHIGDYRSREEISDKIKCKECNREFNPHENEKGLGLFFKITDNGKQFFRQSVKRREFVEAQRNFKIFISPIFRGAKC